MNDSPSETSMRLFDEKIDHISTSSQVTQRLLEYLRSGGARAGERLPSERDLAARLGVGRTAIRGALAALEFLGLVSTRQGAGSYFTDGVSSVLPQAVEWSIMLGTREVGNLREARAVIEVAVAGFAAARGTDEQIAELARIVERMREAVSDANALTELDLQFHLLVAHMAVNEVLSGVLSSIRGLLRAWIRRGLEADEVLATNTLNEHQMILDAIRDRDPDAASAAMRIHLRSAESRLLVALGDDEIEA